MMKKRKIITITIISILLISLFSNLSALADSPNLDLDVEAKSALLMEPSTGRIIYEKNSHEKFAPASVTKIMTMLLTMESVDSGKIKLSDEVVVSETAKMAGKGGSSSMLLDTGEVRTVEELLKGVAIASGNDAAVALAEYLGGSEDAFVKTMNKRAKELKMEDTTFKNCHGLSAEGHLSSAFDISIMSRELIKHKDILKYTGTYMETISEGRLNPIGLVNHNKLVRFFKGCDGLKTGFTNEAKYCISATATKDNVRMLAIIMGAPSYKVRNRDASLLMNYGFSKFEAKAIINKDSEIEQVPLNKKGDKFLIAKASEDFTTILERGKENKIEKKLDLDLSKKEINQGEVIGTCEIIIDGFSVGKIKVYSDRTIKTKGIFQFFKENLEGLFDKAI
ncbi:D-alanyl-D-alanine carboxypeptidase (penicillin-binding protein 5/6) [Clostridium grantii DSM 8605]|uniref:serine-type D-Ala-D-Ala carboxypeptidase n=2 Tax=Clostridium TaxID=1485 RepID=A0A1M5SB72_9CLOT|nr:D-alanyl-D-alanine carboxypeptidase family protein [Clostridium grantii]SHH35715.1 D-alanyl-D-alanine carboxypeptidase (penicillin-binding protein 5/6) [Clostridium grantii DSM 8605]